MESVIFINHLVSVIFFVCYFHQILFIPLSWLLKKEAGPAPEKNSFAVLICARNEAPVIGDLLRSIKAQTYQGKVKIFVLADNCEDNTAEIAASCGAIVYERHNREYIGKGYALEALMNNIRQDFPDGFDAYFVFDADNILEPDYFSEMNKVFMEGYDIVTGYRNIKNYGDNWISAGYGLWFLRESRYLHYPRYLIGSSCNVSGTGFMFSRDVAWTIGGWQFHMLTEDIEFSINQILAGRKIGFCKNAILYDEQPTDFVSSWNQRLRWAKGFVQVFYAYGLKLVKGIFKGSFAAFDMLMFIVPANLLSILCLISNFWLVAIGVVKGEDPTPCLISLMQCICGIESLIFIAGIITTATEWKKIHTSTLKKILYTLTFPLFVFTFLPITIVALVTKVQWKPIKHTISRKI